MLSHSPMRRTAREARSEIGGFEKLELVVSVAVIGMLAALLLERLAYYQEAAEKAAMELEVNQLKVALQVHIGDLIARNQALDYPRIARENPIAWLDRPPLGYRGEFDADVSKDLPDGSWYFDRSSAEVVYLVRLDRYLQPAAGGRARLRWRIELVRPQGPKPKDVTAMGLQLRSVQPYRWF